MEKLCVIPCFIEHNLCKNKQDNTLHLNWVALKKTILSALEDKENIPPNNKKALTVLTQIQTKLLEALTTLTNKVEKIECQLATIPPAASTNTNTDPRKDPNYDPKKDPQYNILFWKRPGCKHKYFWTCGST